MLLLVANKREKVYELLMVFYKFKVSLKDCKLCC